MQTIKVAEGDGFKEGVCFARKLTTLLEEARWMRSKSKLFRADRRTQTALANDQLPVASSTSLFFYPSNN